MRIAILVASALTLSGCQLYFGGDDEPPPCAYEDIAPGYASQELRNPETGECESFGWGGCDYDRPECGPCPLRGEDTPAGSSVANPDWGACYSQCDGLGELSCLQASGCVAAYNQLPSSPGAAAFKACWQTAQSGPIQGGGCWNLDSHECSRHDDCAMYYDTQAMKSQFDHCAPEPTANGCNTVDCGPGNHCEETCYNTCDPKDGMGCDPICQPMCVPDVDQCTAITCGPGYECVQTCDPTTPTMGGGCCAQPGQCQAQCVPLTTCEALDTEMECAARGDCTTVYIGEDCTCYPGYCDCNILTYDRCETVGGMPL